MKITGSSADPRGSETQNCAKNRNNSANQALDYHNYAITSMMRSFVDLVSEQVELGRVRVGIGSRNLFVKSPSNSRTCACRAAFSLF